MCRALLYLGEPVLIDDLLYKPDNSLVKQAYMPKMLHMLNLAGFGMRAWDRTSYEPEAPFSYASPSLPIFDDNLKSMAEKVRADCFLAHVRGVAYNPESSVQINNTHPFHYDGMKIALAHNGDLYRIDEMKGDLLKHIDPDIARRIRGNTDSEWIYALFLSQLDNPTEYAGVDAIKTAVEETLRIIRVVRARCGIATSSSVNLFITDGIELVAVRYCFDFGCYQTEAPEKVHEANLNYLSLWYTSGSQYGYHDGDWQMVGGSSTADTIMVASEPLTRNTSSWLEVPEYSMLYADTKNGSPMVQVHHLDA